MSFTILGGLNENELARFQPSSTTVLRVIVNSDGTRSAELFSVHDKIWQPINGEAMRVIARLVGFPAVEFFDRFKLNSEEN